MKRCNSLMKTLLNGSKDIITPKDKADIKRCIDKLFGDMDYEGGCLFLKTHNGQAVFNAWTDKLEFEAWHNEILINSEFSGKRITAKFALEFFDYFCGRLKTTYPPKICSVMSEDEGAWTFRFHIVREGEPLLISEDIEKYPQPVLYEIFGGE